MMATKQLRYVDSNGPGYTRKPWGTGFTYLDVEGNTITDGDGRERIEALKIPPAWINVWICPDPKGHIQATGYDSKGRKQYRYHPLWVERRQQDKFDRLAAVGEVLPTIRATVDSHLRKRRLSQEKVLATVVYLLEKTLIRIGNDEYALRNESYGLTTLQDDHVKIHGERIKFDFQGKSGKQHMIDLESSRLARIVKACREIPGYDLFQYEDDDGDYRSIASQDVNQYLREISQEDLTAKDFRTWGGSRLAVAYMVECQDSAEPYSASGCVKHVAAVLGNTPHVCKSYYIHPAILEVGENGSFPTVDGKSLKSPHDLDEYEQSLMEIITS
jgi:DNA topoisomerase-1